MVSRLQRHFLKYRGSFVALQDIAGSLSWTEPSMWHHCHKWYLLWTRSPIRHGHTRQTFSAESFRSMVDQICVGFVQPTHGYVLLRTSVLPILAWITSLLCHLSACPSWEVVMVHGNDAALVQCDLQTVLVSSILPTRCRGPWPSCP